MKYQKLLLAFLMIPALSACGSVETTFANAREKLEKVELSLPSFTKGKAETEIAAAAEDIPCPKIVVVNDMDLSQQFINETRPQPGYLISSAAITHITSQCELTENNLIVDIGIRFSGALGPATEQWKPGQHSFAYPYFLAIADSSGHLLTKEIYGLTLNYHPGQSTVTKTETLRQLMPRSATIEGQPQILVGFQLTPAQMAYVTGSPTTAPESLPEKKPAAASRAAQPQQKGQKLAPTRKPQPVAPATAVQSPVPEYTTPAVDPAPQPKAAPVEPVIEEDIPPPDMELIQPGEPLSLIKTVPAETRSSKAEGISQ